MELKQALINAVNEVLPMFGLQLVYQGETEEAQLASAQQVNILIGLNGGIRGNIVIGCNKTTALRIVSAMMGGAPVDNLDVIAKSALSEATNMIGGTAVGKVEVNGIVSFSPPTIVTGDRLFLLISRNKSTKLSYRLENSFLHLCFSLE